MVGYCRRVQSLQVRVFGLLRVIFAPYPLTHHLPNTTTTSYKLNSIMPSFIEIKAHKAQCEAERIQLQQKEEADLREQERLEREEEEGLVREADKARLEEARKQE